MLNTHINVRKDKALGSPGTKNVKITQPFGRSIIDRTLPL